MLYRIAACEAKDEKLLLHFKGGEVLSVWSPGELVMDRRTFKILDADRVRWEWSTYVRPPAIGMRYFLDYAKEDGRLHATTNHEHIRDMRPSLDQPAVHIEW